MNKIIITFSSVTYAMKARKLLSHNGISAKLIKLGGEFTLGCTHGLEISEHAFLDSVNELRKNGIEYSVYRKNER